MPETTGASVGSMGAGVGASVGSMGGAGVGASVGAVVGSAVGSGVTVGCGVAVGASLGCAVGSALGVGVGVGVGVARGSVTPSSFKRKPFVSTASSVQRKTYGSSSVPTPLNGFECSVISVYSSACDSGTGVGVGSGSGSGADSGSGSAPTHFPILTEHTGQSVFTVPAAHFSGQEQTACSTPAASAAASRSPSSTTLKK